MTDDQYHALWFGAFSYYTGAGCLTPDAPAFGGMLIDAWPTLPEVTRTTVLQRLEEYAKNPPFLWATQHSQSWQQVHERLIVAESAHALREAILSELPGTTAAIPRKGI